MNPLVGFIDELEQIMARFFWARLGRRGCCIGFLGDRSAYQLMEGPGYPPVCEMAVAFGFNLWWRLLAQDSLWAQFMVRKYCILPCRVHSSALLSRDSHVWRRLCRTWSLLHDFIRWSLGEGNISFWDDVWLGARPIRDLCLPGSVLPPKEVSSFWHEHTWDEDILYDISFRYGVPTDVIDEIRATPIEVGAKDVMRWSLTNHGGFSVTSAWEHVRTRMPRH